MSGQTALPARHGQELRRVEVSADALPRGPAPENFDASKFCGAT